MESSWTLLVSAVVVFLMVNDGVVLAVEMTFDPQVFVVSETMGLLSPGILLSHPSPVSFDLSIDVVNINTTGNV